MNNQQNKQPYMTKEVAELINNATEISKKYRQKWCNTAHVFASTMAYLANASEVRTAILKTKNKSFYKYILNKKLPKEHITYEVKDGYYYVLDENTEIPATEEVVKFNINDSESNNSADKDFAYEFIELFDKYGIDSLNFHHVFLLSNPSLDEDDEEDITIKSDIKTILTILKQSYLNTKTQPGVKELVGALFSDYTYELYSLFELLGNMHINKETYSFRTPKAFNASDLYSEILTLVQKYRVMEQVKTLPDLDKIPSLSNLNKYVKENPVEILEVDNVINKMEIQLNSEEYPCLVLVGKSGVGKTAVVKELAQRINKGEVSERLKNKVIYELSVNDLVAGSKFRGDFEQKCQVIFNACKKNKDAIIFIDEGHLIADAGSGRDDGGDLSLGNILKPYISRGEITIITATTTGEYKHFEKDRALAGRFQRIPVQEPSDETCTKIINGVMNRKEKDYLIKVENRDELIKYILEEGFKFMPNESNAKRSLKLLDGAFAYASKNHKKSLNVEDLKLYLSTQYDIVISDNKAEDTREQLLSELLGQDDAINKVCDNLEACELGLADPKKPMYSMIFAGPTGTGKSHTAKSIAKYYFGNENNVISLDMAKYSEAHSVSNLIGTSKGYVGYNDETPLIAKVKQTPNSVVIFDEIEKAHPSIFPTFLRILDEGELEDNKGGIVSFRNTIIIFTTNLGFDHTTGKPSGAGLFKEVAGTTNVLPALKKNFTPEFLGRIDDIVVYNYLPEMIVKDLIYRTTKEEMSRSVIKMDIEYTDEEIKEITEKAKVQTEGARNIAKQVKKVLVQKLLAEKRKRKEEAVCH